MYFLGLLAALCALRGRALVASTLGGGDVFLGGSLSAGRIFLRVWLDCIAVPVEVDASHLCEPVVVVSGADVT